MKALMVVRIYLVVTLALLVGWCINLGAALTRPTVEWRYAVGMPLLVIIFLTLIMLVRARRRLSADQAVVVGIPAGQYVVAGLAAAGLVAAVLVGFRAHG